MTFLAGPQGFVAQINAPVRTSHTSSTLAGGSSRRRKLRVANTDSPPTTFSDLTVSDKEITMAFNQEEFINSL